MDKYIYFIIANVISFATYAQTYNMSNGTTTTCSGTFYDNGNTGNYTNNQNLTHTFCATSGNQIEINFSSFDLENNYDFLYIYDGNSTTAPSIGTFTNTNNPGTITSTSGCLTIRFTTDGSVTRSGWTATISCISGNSILMSNSSTTTCTGTFYDSGGSGGNYGNNENYVYTICPSITGNKVEANFTSFNIENNYDFLEIFDGPNTSAPSLGTYTGTLGPGLTQATPSNTSGCLTFRFTTDGSVTRSGWIAAISCFSNCQTITANLNSTSPTADADGIIRLCQGQSVNFVGSGTFSNNNAGATYAWDMGDGTTIIGTSINHTYTTSGSYSVNLLITDNAGCINNNVFNQVVQVSTTPTLATVAAPGIFCQGNSSVVTGTAIPTAHITNCTPPVSGTTFLPDGSGVSYTTSIPVNCYAPGQTITSATDIVDVCLNMEHSYLGDLEVRIICPNGQSAVLKSYADGGAGTYLGEAIDDLTSGPGTGYNYCFTPTATTLLVNGATTNVGSPASASIVAGNYQPTQSFANLIGCPANGNWTIEVTDNLAQDDGYIFNWDLDLAATLFPTGSFTPTIVSETWTPSPSLSPLTSNTASITPTAPGNACYTYEVTDNFGCTYSDVLCATVTPASTPPVLAPVGGTLCPNTSVTLTASGGQASSGSTIEWYTGPNGTGTSLGSGNSLTVTPTNTTSYYVRREGGCNTTADDMVLVDIKDYIYGLDGATTSNYCTDNTGWHHFYNGNEILLSIHGDLSGAPAGYPEITIRDNGTWHQQSQGPFSPSACALTGNTPGEERFEMERSWNVDFGGGTLIPPYQVRFYYEPTERIAIETAAATWAATYAACGYTYKYPTPNGLFWFKNTGSNYSAPDYDGTHLPHTTGITSNSINYVELSGITSFSGGTAALILTPDQSLPSEWLYFKGETNTKTNFLSWATASEINSDYFNIQRSKDGISFETIGAVAAQGNSTNTHHYTFDDKTPYKGINYYRLELIDTDGAISYSTTIQLIIPEDGLGYLFYPNPTQDVIHYQYEASSKEFLEIQVIDVYGRTLSTKSFTATMGLNTVPIHLNSYPTGSYMIRVHHLNSANVHTVKAIKSTY